MHEAVDTHLDAGAQDPRQVGNRAVHCLRQDWAHACRIIEANSGQRIPIALRLVRHALSLRNKYLKIPQILALGGFWWTSLDHDREGIEPPTRGFSAASRAFQGFINQSLASACQSLPRHITAQLRHTQSGLVTFLAQRITVWCVAANPSGRRPSPFPKRRSEHRACGQFGARPSQLGAERVQPSPQSWGPSCQVV